MKHQPFVTLHSQPPAPVEVHVPVGHAGFVLHGAEPLRLESGLHEFEPTVPLSIFLVPVDGSHPLDLESSGALLRDERGHWRRVRIAGRLRYRVVHPERLVDLLHREEMHQSQQFETELGRRVLERIASFLEGDTWRAETLTRSLACASGALRHQIEEIFGPLGVELQSLELRADLPPLGEA